LASKPVIKVIAPPKTQRTPYSYHLVLARAEKSKETLIGSYRNTNAQPPTAQINHTASAEMAAGAACHLYFIISHIVAHEYKNSATAPTIIERASIAA
jgi:hypothetical protein